MRSSRVDVALTPAAIAPAQTAVVIDVLRASSTITQALDAGYRRVICCESIDAARRHRAPGRVLAGESRCLRVPDFELGNSPAAVAAGEPLGEELVMATTNGSPAILAAALCSQRVVIGCLLNLAAVVAAIRPDGEVTIVCAGTDGRAAIEDIYAAGRIVGELEAERSDAALVAERVATGFADPLEPLSVSADGAVLRSSGQGGDISWCAGESRLDIVPEVSDVGDDAATVTALSRREPHVAGRTGVQTR
ncbi:MAG: 2-phosphosulfolactate phosphatase [Solirubrobacterales bacterium]